MTKPPVLDVLYQALLTRDQDVLNELESNRAAECIDLRAIISTDNPTAVPLDLGLGLMSSIYVTPIFEGPRAFFMSRHISVQARLTGGTTTVPIDYSLSFDSNFAERLRAFISGENIQQIDRDRVTEVLMLKANNARVQFDVVPFLYENIRLARDNKENNRPLNTLTAFRMLDHLNWEAFRSDPSRFDFGAPAETLRASLRQDASTFLTSEYANPSVIHHEAKSLGVQALLLRFATLWHKTKKRDVRRVLGELLEFCVSKLGFIPTTELSLIWTGIKKKVVDPFFGPIINPSEKTIKEIRGMAWDMTHLRIMEQSARKTQLGSFFIPHFVSIDRRWRDLLRLNPVRLMLVDDAENSALFARSNELEFQKILHECASDKLLAERSPEKIAERRAAASSINVESMQNIVLEEERTWLCTTSSS